MAARLQFGVGLTALLLLVDLSTIIYACEKEIEDDVCPQREGFDKDCEQRCQYEYPHRLSSSCHLRSTGTLLSFFGIKSFICKCKLPEQFCSVDSDSNIQRRSFSLEDLSLHSTLAQLSTNAACTKTTASSLSCHDEFGDIACAWQRSYGGDWYVAEPHSTMPFASGEAPTRRYLVGVAKGGSGSLQLHTCPALCSVDSVNVTAKIWRGPSVGVELCFREEEAIMCSPLRISNGVVVNEVIPQTSKFQISIIFTNMTDGDVVLIDDISAQFNECSLPVKIVSLASRGVAKELSQPSVLREVNMTKTSAVGTSMKKSLERRSGNLKGAASGHEALRRKFCKPGDCTMLVAHKSSRSTSLDRMCVGRIGVLHCREKCIKNGGSGKFARCVRQRESPFTKRCLCGVRRSPLHRVDGDSRRHNDIRRSENKSHSRQALMTDVGWSPTMPAEFQDLQEDGHNEVLVEENVCGRQGGDELCDHNCRTSHMNSSGQCEVSAGQIICRCSSCVTSLCDFEIDECGWLDMNAIHKEFGNFSIASKQNQRNNYGLSRISSGGRSGLFRRGPFNGPITLSLDIYPTEGIHMQICIENLQKCQTQRVLPRLWNRVRAKITVTQADQIFLLFLNRSNKDQTMAVDNVWMKSGQCSRINSVQA